MMPENLPPMDRHADFFREVVALARSHKMTGLTLKFRDAFAMNTLEGGYLGFVGVWSEGRHGSKGFMELRWDASTRIEEQSTT